MRSDLKIIAGLSEMMADFLRDLPKLEQAKAIDAVRDIMQFVSLSGRTAHTPVTIDKTEANHFGADQAAALLGKEKFPLSVYPDQLIEVWDRSTEKWQSDQWIRLKMAICVRLGIQTQELDALSKEQTEKSWQEAHARVAAESAQMDAWLDSPERKRQLLAGLNCESGSTSETLEFEPVEIGLIDSTALRREGYKWEEVEFYLVKSGDRERIELLWLPSWGRAGISSGADISWIDASSPQDAIRKHLGNFSTP